MTTLLQTFQKILHSNVLPCPLISDHDALYISTNKHQPRYKLISGIRNFSLQKHIDDLNSVQPDTLNKIIFDCIKLHAPLKRTKINQPPAPWMKDPIQSQFRIEETN